MADTTVRRTLASLRYRRGTVVWALACASASALVWAGVLVATLPLADVILSHAGTELAEDNGVLPLVEYYRYHWSGAVLRGAYESMPWLQSNRSALGGLLMLVVALVALSAVFRYAHECLGSAAAAGATGAHRRAVLSHAYQLGTMIFRSQGASHVVDRLTTDVQAVENGLRCALVGLAHYGLWALASLAVAVVIDPLMALLFLALGALVWYVVRLIVMRERRRVRLAVEQGAKQLAGLQATLLSMRLVKSFGMETYQQQRFNTHVQRYEQDTLRAARAEALGAVLALLAGVVSVTLFVGLAGYYVLLRRLGVSAAITLSIALWCLSLYVWRLTRLRPVFRQMRRRARVLFRFLDTEPEVAQVPGAKFLSPMAHSLAFHHVTLARDSGRPFLADVSFTIELGWQVAVMGLSAPEKHALLNLIPRLMDPSEGEVRIDGEDIRWVTLESLRAQVALVPRDVVLLGDTVRTNISGGDSGYTLARIADAAKMAHAHHFIQNLPMGYETVVGEHGERLTPGQQHRIGLARAILRDPAIVLIEEPVEPFDAESQGLIDDALARFMPGRTLICIAHRMATIRQATKVLCLHHGRVAALGSHAELTASSDLYRHLQYVEFNAFATEAAEADGA